MTLTYKQWVNDQRTVLVTQYEDGLMFVALREQEWHTWGPLIAVKPA